MMRRARALAVVLVASTAAAFAAAQDLGNVDYVEECPVQNGFFADAVQCDRYYECKNGEVRSTLQGEGFNIGYPVTSYEGQRGFDTSVSKFFF